MVPIMPVKNAKGRNRRLSLFRIETIWEEVSAVGPWAKNITRLTPVRFAIRFANIRVFLSLKSFRRVIVPVPFHGSGCIASVASAPRKNWRIDFQKGTITLKNAVENDIRDNLS